MADVEHSTLTGTSLHAPKAHVHTEYLESDGTDVMTGTLNMDGYDIINTSDFRCKSGLYTVFFSQNDTSAFQFDDSYIYIKRELKPSTTNIYNLGTSTRKWKDIYGTTLHGTLAASEITGTLSEARGGTDQSTYAQGDVLYASGTNTLAKLTKGTATQVLTMNAGATAPEWAAGGGGGAGDMLKSTYDPNDDGVIAVGQTEANNYSHPGARTCTSGNWAWSSITGEPSYTTRWPTWSEVTSKPSTFTPSSHDLDSHGSCTLAQLSADITDATLINTTDSRLSNARTPTSHGHSYHTNRTRTIKLPIMDSSYDGAGAGYTMGASADNHVTTYFKMPADAIAGGGNATLKVYYYMGAASSNNVVFNTDVSYGAVGTESRTATNGDMSATITPGNNTYYNLHTPNTALTWYCNANDFVKVIITRLGTNAADTHTSVMYVVGIELSYMSDM